MLYLSYSTIFAPIALARVRYSSGRAEGVIEKGPLAHLVEHLPLKQGVAGSSPARLILLRRYGEKLRCGYAETEGSKNILSEGGEIGTRASLRS